MVEKVFHQFHRDRKTKPFAEGDFHVGHADNFTGEIEERAAAVAGIDLRAGLQIQVALHLPRFGADDALRDGAFEAERAADGKHAVAHVQGVGVAESDGLEFRRAFVLDVQQREVVKFVDGDNFYLLVSLAVELAVFLVINFHGNFRLAFDDVEIGDEIAVVIQKKAGAEAAGCAHLHHGFANLFHQRADVARGGGFGGGGVKLSRHRCRGGDGRRRAGFADAGDDAARNHQHGVAQIHDEGIGFFGENFAGNGGVLELKGVGGQEGRTTTEQRGQDKKFLQRHPATIDHRWGFDKRAAVILY